MKDHAKVIFGNKISAKDYRNAVYRVLKYDLKRFGDLVNTATPVHIKQDSLIHNVIAKFVLQPGEIEDYKTTGEILMSSGIFLKPAYSATGYNENTRLFTDFESRMYFIEEVK